jgi:toxin secretion/phage lysis holin
MKVEQLWDSLHLALATVGGFLGWFLGGLDGAIYVLLACTTADYVSGVACAFVKKELSSEIGARGIAKKVIIFALIGIGHMLDTHLLGGGQALRTALIFWYVGNEGISLVENAVILGVPVPDFLKDALAQLKNRSEHKPDQNDKGDDSK